MLQHKNCVVIVQLTPEQRDRCLKLAQEWHIPHPNIRDKIAAALVRLVDERAGALPLEGIIAR